MTHARLDTGDEPTRAPRHPQGTQARRALILRRAANATSRRILRTLDEDMLRERLAAAEAEQRATPAPAAPLGRPIEPAAAIVGETNRWGGRL